MKKGKKGEMVCDEDNEKDMHQKREGGREREGKREGGRKGESERK